jgi:hypothetical protein
MTTLDQIPDALSDEDIEPVELANSEVIPSDDVDALCQEFWAVCQSAVDPLEIASTLEFNGWSDHAIEESFGFPDVFALATEMHRRVPRQPLDPQVSPDPWGPSRFRPLLHGLLYVLPAVCFPAAAGLLTGRGVLAVLVAALLAAWALSQGLAYLGYTRRGQAGPGHERPLLRRGLAVGLAVVVLAVSLTALLAHAPLAVVLFGSGEGAYMLGGSVLLVLGAEWWLMLALAPGVAASAVFLGLGRPLDLEHLVWIGLAATPALALVLAVMFTKRTSPSVGRTWSGTEVLRALPSAWFGLAAAGLLAFPIAAGVHGHGGVNTAALLAALSISLSMGVAEASLLWYRRRTQRLLRVTGDLGRFVIGARAVLLVALLQYAVAAAALMAAVVAVAAGSGLTTAHWSELPQLASYAILGAAMFLALAVQAFGLRAFIVVAISAALGFEIAFRDLGVPAQLVACGVLLVAVGAYATLELGKVVRHGY